MEKSIDLRINETKMELVNVANKSGLPISVLRMILNELYTQVSETERQTLNEEINKLKKAEEEKKEENATEETPLEVVEGEVVSD